MKTRLALLSLTIASAALAAPCQTYGRAATADQGKAIAGVVSAVNFDYGSQELVLKFDALTIDGVAKTCLVFDIPFSLSAATVAQGLHKQALVSLTLGYTVLGSISSTDYFRLVSALELRRP